jgi:hypothetical protein
MYYYCINVVLGNNSGYPIILAAVGFLRHVNNTEYRDSAASYLSTRTMVQYGQVISARAISISALQAAGAILAGAAAFSGNAGRKGRIAIWSTLVGTVAAGVVGAVVPDHTIKETSNLDDAALRDGRLIPNNSPVRFAVFVDRDVVKPLLLRSPDQLKRDAEDAEQMADDLLAQPLRDPALQKERDEQIKRWREWAREMRLEATAHPLKDYTKVEGHSKIVNPLARKKALLSGNLISVRRALGNLIIVGDQIEYLQRIQIDSSAVVPTVQTVALTSVAPSSGTQGSSVPVTLTGTNFASGSTVAVSGSG